MVPTLVQTKFSEWESQKKPYEWYQKKKQIQSAEDIWFFHIFESFFHKFFRVY